MQLKVAAATVGFFGAGSAIAQTQCGQSIGPDLIIGDISAPLNYASVDGIEACSFGLTHCNIGTAAMNTIASPSTQHQLTGQALYRLKSVEGASRIEQIGQSWVLDGFCSLASALCCQCQPPDAGCAQLGAGCSSPETASIAGFQNGLRPKWQVNAATATFPVPPANPPFSGAIARRLQVKIADIDPAQNGGGQYFAEVYAIAPDDTAAGFDLNNASHRPVNVSGSVSTWNFAVTATTVRQQPAIHAWQASDPSVMETPIDVLGDGRFILAAQATDLGNGLWRYEYAVENLNSDRSGVSFAVALPTGAIVSNVGFHDVDYHSGDGPGNVNISGTDWSVEIASDSIAWSTEPFSENPGANALRWGTLYNFRFDCNAEPMNGDATIGLFKPGAPGDVVSETIVPGIVLPPPTCLADVAPPGPPSGDGEVNIDDLLAVIEYWGFCPPPKAYCPDLAPEGGDGQITVDDLLIVVNGWGPCQ